MQPENMPQMALAQKKRFGTLALGLVRSQTVDHWKALLALGPGDFLDNLLKGVCKIVTEEAPSRPVLGFKTGPVLESSKRCDGR